MPNEQVRARRSAGPVVAVTGAATGAGRLLARLLAGNTEIRKVVAIDGHRGDVPGVLWRVVDVRDPLLSRRLSDVDVIVHLDLEQSPERAPRERRTHNVRGAQTVLAAAGAARVRQVVLVTGAMVYGAGPGDPVPLPEDGPVRAEPDSGVVGDLLEIEELAARATAAHPGVTVTVVRPAALVGPAVDTVVTRHFEAPRPLAVRGAPQRWQFCHLDDLATALERVVLGRIPGVVAVGCEGWLEAGQVAEITGRRSLELPAALVFGVTRGLHRLGLTPAPAADLRSVVHPRAVDCATLRAAGWKPKYDNAAALRLLAAETAGRHTMAGRRMGGKEATAAAVAGAATAVIAAAALLHARRRRR